MNVLKIIRNDATGEAVLFHITDGGLLDAKIALHDATIGELTNGTSTISSPSVYNGDRLTFTLDTNPNDGDTAGSVAYAELQALTDHTAHPHGHKPVIDDPLEALRTELAELKERLNAPAVMVFDEVYQREYTRPDNTRHFGFHFFNRDNSEFQFATGDFTYGLVKVSDDVQHLRVRFYNNNGDVVQELRAPVSTNDFTGFDYKMHGLAKTITGAFAYSDFAVADSKAREAAGDASGDAGGSGGDAT